MAGKPRRGGGGVARGGQGGRAAKAGSHRKGASSGSGGQRRKALEGRGATPPAEMRLGHPAQRRAEAAKRADVAKKAEAAKRPDAARSHSGAEPDVRRDAGSRASGARAPGARDGGPRAGFARGRRVDADEMVVGRNPVVEALRARIPSSALYIAGGLDYDDRITEVRTLANRAGIMIVDVGKAELDRMCPAAPHQGLALSVPAYRYAHPDDLLARAEEAPPGLLVGLDGVTDPRNLGAVVRSAAAFGAHGVVVPERRAAGMTAAAWKTSAGAAARLPVAQAKNLERTLTSWAQAGLLVVGLAGDGELSLDDFEAAADPLVLVVGSEGRGLSRLVGQRCDLRVRIPMTAEVASLNAGVAAGVALAEIARRRRLAAA